MPHPESGLDVVGVVGIAFFQTGQHTFQCVAECLAKIPIKVGIDKRIQGGVEVADPEEHHHQNIRAGAGGTAQRSDDIPVGWEEKKTKNEIVTRMSLVKNMVGLPITDYSLRFTDYGLPPLTTGRRAASRAERRP